MFDLISYFIVIVIIILLIGFTVFVDIIFLCDKVDLVLKIGNKTIVKYHKERK